MKITNTELIWNSLSLTAGMEKQIPWTALMMDMQNA